MTLGDPFAINKMMKKYIVILVLLVLVYFVVNTMIQAGVFKTIENHSDLTNTKIYNNMAGPEDLDIDKENGLLFISQTDRWKLRNGEQTNDGIYLLNLNKDTVPYKLHTTFAGEFHPHGITFLKKDESNYLFVINHNQNGSSVELFRFSNDTLFHLVSFKDDMMCCPNDLVAVDIDQFYVTNDHGYKEGIMRTLEDYLRLPKSYLLYFDGQSFSKVYEGLNYANGVNVSPSGKNVYVTETTGRKISVLDRDISTGELKLRFTKDLETGLDNITIDSDGNLWIATHPKLFDFVGHSKDPDKKSPSQVLKLSPKGDDDFTVTEVYLDNGEELSGTSTALYYNDQVFIGVVFENNLLRGDYKIKN